MASETITQADREAAAEFAESIATRSKSERAEILRGDADLDCYVQAFAAHRTAAVAELVEAAQVFSLIVRDDVPDDELVDCIAWTARDFRKLAKALSRHQAGLGKGEG